MDEDNQLWVEMSYKVFSFRAKKLTPKRRKNIRCQLLLGRTSVPFATKASTRSSIRTRRFAEA